jgi:hypothetical protein
METRVLHGIKLFEQLLKSFMQETSLQSFNKFGHVVRGEIVDARPHDGQLAITKAHFEDNFFR